MRVVAILAAVCALTAARPAGAAEASAELPSLTQVLSDLQALERIMPLKLTDKQVDDLLRVYADADAVRKEEGLNLATQAQLQQMREQLLAGKPLGLEDDMVLRGILGGGALWRPVGYDVTLLIPKLEKIITASQMDVLANPYKYTSAYRREARRTLASKHFWQVRTSAGLNDRQWEGFRTREVEAVTQDIADATQKKAVQEKVAAFFDRLRAMPARDLQAQQSALMAEFVALLPDPPVQAGQAPGPAALSDQQKRGLFWFFGQPGMPRLLAELKAEGAKPAAAPVK